MKKHIIAIAMAASVISLKADIWNVNHLNNVRENSLTPFYKEVLTHLYREADSILALDPMSVTDKETIAASGSKNDYVSQARYFWRNPESKDGLPYINRDGITNPEIYKLDRERLGLTADRIKKLALAHFFSGERKYSDKAKKLADVWFLDKKTRMNPNLEYAQMIPGVNGGKGRCYGVLDAYSFIELIEALKLLEESESFSKTDVRKLKEWFGNLTDWMLESPQGREESQQANNHSTAYDAMVTAFALYSGKKDLAEEIIRKSLPLRVENQINPDGRQPHELTRTLAYGYSQYNLTHFLDMIELAINAGIDAGLTDSGYWERVEKGLEYLSEYIGKDAKEWEYGQISDMEGKKQAVLKDLYRANILDKSNNGFESKYLNNRILDYSDLFNILYYCPSATDNAMAVIAPQLRFAIECADSARKSKENLLKRGVTPRSIDKSGNLVMVGSHDWCSGFFAGTLWQMYDYTKNQEWRENAISWTWPIEDAKLHKGTHDLGFMMNDSFGKAYKLTDEKSYRDVVVRSAETLATRYNPVVKSIRSWDHNAHIWKYPVIIDNIMNLEMLFEATRLTGDSTYYNIALNHAETTLKNHFRDDHSSYHVVDYDPETGHVRMKCTHQGFSDDSFWSRGQAWGLYGFAQCYKYTGDRRFLEKSERIADFILSLPNMPEDGIPYWDMKDPRVSELRAGEENPDCPRDASSAAIIASGLYMLGDLLEKTKDNLSDNTIEKVSEYRKHADNIIANLTDHYRVGNGEKYGFILDHSTGHHPAGSEIDVPLNYADYYYMEALLRQSR